MNRHVALKGKNDLTQYLDSTCSKHRCENKALFSTFEIGEMESLLLEMPLAPILGKDSWDLWFSYISNVLHVEDLKSNLLSISQIRDDDYEINFSRKGELCMTLTVLWSWKEEEHLIIVLEFFQILTMCTVASRLIWLNLASKTWSCELPNFLEVGYEGISWWSS